MIAQERLRRDQKSARSILPLVSGHYFGERFPRWANPTNSHVLLVTMLLVNSAANEALPLFLDRLVPSWLAISLSVTVVLLFGEILPSAIFTGPNQLRIAAMLAPLVRFLRLVMLPLAGPIGVALDTCLGEHSEEEEDRREEMKAMAKTLQLQGLERDEVTMIHGVLEMHSKTAGSIATPLDKARMLAHDAILTQELVQELLCWGHSRVFVYRRDLADPARCDDIIGVLLVKKLLGVNIQDERTVSSIEEAIRSPVLLSPVDNLLAVLNKFQAGRCHLAIIGDDLRALKVALAAGEEMPLSARPTSFCSLEDVMEAMLKEDIFDEVDEELGRAPPKTPANSTSASYAPPYLGRHSTSFSSRPALPGLLSSLNRSAHSSRVLMDLARNQNDVKLKQAAVDPAPTGSIGSMGGILSGHIV